MNDYQSYLTTEHASELAHCTRANVQHQIKRGKLRAIKFSGRWMIDREDFGKWITSPRQVGRPRKANKNV